MKLVPNKSLGNFKFGMNIEDIINIMGKPTYITIDDILNCEIISNDKRTYITENESFFYMKLSELLIKIKDLNNFNTETNFDLEYKNLSFMFDLYSNKLVLRSIYTCNLPIIYNKVNLFDLNKIELINLFNNFKYQTSNLACSLNFDDLGLMFHYDDKFEQLEAITVSTNMFDE